MSGSGREAIPDVRKWSGGHAGCPGVVGRPSRCPRVVGRPFRMFGSCREALSDVREWSGGPLGCPGVVRRPSRMSGSGREELPDV